MATETEREGAVAGSAIGPCAHRGGRGAQPRGDRRTRARVHRARRHRRAHRAPARGRARRRPHRLLPALPRQGRPGPGVHGPGRADGVRVAGGARRPLVVAEQAACGCRRELADGRDLPRDLRVRVRPYDRGARRAATWSSSCSTRSPHWDSTGPHRALLPVLRRLHPQHVRRQCRPAAARTRGRGEGRLGLGPRSTPRRPRRSTRSHASTPAELVAVTDRAIYDRVVDSMIRRWRPRLRPGRPSAVSRRSSTWCGHPRTRRTTLPGREVDRRAVLEGDGAAPREHDEDLGGLDVGDRSRRQLPDADLRAGAPSMAGSTPSACRPGPSTARSAAGRAAGRRRPP